MKSRLSFLSVSQSPSHTQALSLSLCLSLSLSLSVSRSLSLSRGGTLSLAKSAGIYRRRFQVSLLDGRIHPKEKKKK